MRILQVTHYMPPHTGGIERVAAALSRGLQDRGHEVRWISSAAGGRPGWDGPAFRVAAWNVLEDRLGVPYPLWGPSGLATLARQVRWAEVVHLHDCLYLSSAAAAFAAAAMGRPVLLTQHVGQVPFGRLLDQVQRLAYRTVGRTVLAAADRAVVCSPHVPDSLAAIGVRGDFEVVPNVVDLARFGPASPERRRQARASLGVPPDGKLLLFVGRLVPKKGIPSLLNLLAALEPDGGRLLVVGEGRMSERIRGVQRLAHLPFVEPARMPEVYAAADLFVLPSRGEGLPLSVQEALAAGLPVVVSDDPSFRCNLAGAPGVGFAVDDEQLRDLTRGLLAEPAPPATIAAWANERWGVDRFLGRYESLLTEIRGARSQATAPRREV